MINLKKSSFAGVVLAIAAVSAYAGSIHYTKGWSGSPYNYTGEQGCSWNFYSSHGSQSGASFDYSPIGACTYTSMTITHANNASSVDIFLTN